VKIVAQKYSKPKEYANLGANYWLLQKKMLINKRLIL
jgi:hypothetical protein